jgi:dTDP-4-amino-4,6-dideoxygalactose transaminase
METMKEAGISTAIQYPKALPLLSAYSARGYRPEKFPHAHRLAERCVSLPMYPELTRENIERVVAGVRKALAVKS